MHHSFVAVKPDDVDWELHILHPERVLPRLGKHKEHPLSLIEAVLDCQPLAPLLAGFCNVGHEINSVHGHVDLLVVVAAIVAAAAAACRCRLIINDCYLRLQSVAFGGCVSGRPEKQSKCDPGSGRYGCNDGNYRYCAHCLLYNALLSLYLLFHDDDGGGDDDTTGLASRRCTVCVPLPCCIILGSLPTRLKYDASTSAHGSTCLLSTFDWRLTMLLVLSCFNPPRQLILSAQFTRSITSVALMPEILNPCFSSITSTNSAGISDEFMTYSSIWADRPFSTIFASSTAFIAIAGSASSRHFNSLALPHSSSKFFDWSAPNESIEAKRAALPLLLSTDTIWVESMIIRLDDTSATFSSIPSGSEKTLSLPMHCAPSIALIRVPFVTALISDGLHWASSLSPQGSSMAVMKERECAIRLPIFFKAEFGSSIKYLFSSEPLGRWPSSFIFCRRSTIFFMFFTLRSCRLTISENASSGGIALQISGFCFETTASLFFSSFFTVW